MRDATRQLVDEWWAEWFGLSVAALRAPGVKVVTHAGLGDYPGVYVLVLGAAVVVSSPARITEPLTDVLGPSAHLYADQPPEEVDGCCEVRYDDLGALRLSAGAGAWEESGFGDRAEVCFGIEQDGKVVAASNLTEWRGAPADVGVLVDPAYTGRGLGTRAAAGAARHAIERFGVARYRALTTNPASLRIARTLGFTPYGMNLAITPGRPPWPQPRSAGQRFD